MAHARVATSSRMISRGGGGGEASILSVFTAAKSHATTRGAKRLISTFGKNGPLASSPSLGFTSGAGQGVGCKARSGAVQRRGYATAAAAAASSTFTSTSTSASASTSKDSSASTSTSTTPVDVESRQTFATEKQKQKQKLKADVCALLRDVAQPVAVVTSIKSLPPSPSSSRSASASTSSLSTQPVEDADEAESAMRSAVLPEYHGATLSSFTSIAMDPYPLVAFALRIPSRMASALTAMAEAEESSKEAEEEHAHMVINLLAASQAQTAFTFSRPDLHPTPFSGSGTRYTLSADGLPVIHGSVGALSCRLVGRPIPLYDLNHLERKQREGVAVMPPLRREKGEVASELFIARVVRVEPVLGVDEGEDVVDAEAEAEAEERPLPLVYHRRSYTTCTPKS